MTKPAHSRHYGITDLIRTDPARLCPATLGALLLGLALLTGPLPGFAQVRAPAAPAAPAPAVTPASAATPAVSKDKPAIAGAQALVEAGIRSENAEGTVRDYAKAHDLYCEAARMQSADALLRLGWMYANGRGVARDDATAHTLFERAGKLGNEMGGRLAGMIRAAPGTPPSPPACLVASANPDPAFSFAPGVKPAIDNPARFSAAPTSPAQLKLVQAVVAQSREHRIDPRLVLAIMRAESGFDPQARSPKNAHGLMQLLPETAERFAVANIHDPVQNVRGGIRYLCWLLSYFRGDVVLTLAAYNAGEGAVDRYKGVPPFPETMAYVARVRALYPRDRHPYDAEAASASPLVSDKLANDELTSEKLAAADASASAGGAMTTDPAPPVRRVRYFLGKTSHPLAQSNR